MNVLSLGPLKEHFLEMNWHTMFFTLTRENVMPGKVKQNFLICYSYQKV